MLAYACNDCPYKIDLIQNEYNLLNKSVSQYSSCQDSLLKYIQDDADKLHYSFEKYKPGMSGGYRVLLFTAYYAEPGYTDEGKPIKKVSEYDYHWWRFESDGTWSNKHGGTAINSETEDTGITVDSKNEAISMVKIYYEDDWKKENVQINLVGNYYIREK